MADFSPISNSFYISPYDNSALTGPRYSVGQNSGPLQNAENREWLPGPRGSRNKEDIPGLRDAGGKGEASGISGEEKGKDNKRIPGDPRKPQEECQTCKNRKYKDGSDEMVSFKNATHISPEAAASAVRAHEQEHVSNAYKKAATDNGKVISASVSIHTAICPECGRTYVSGGTTHTQIKYFNEENPYQKGLKSADHAKYSGRNADYAV